MSIWQGLGTIAVLLLVSVASIVADRRTRPPQWYGTPKLGIGLPITVEDERFRGERRETYRRQFVTTHITHGPDGTFVELQDLKSYERRNRWPG